MESNKNNHETNFEKQNKLRNKKSFTCKKVKRLTSHVFKGVYVHYTM